MKKSLRVFEIVFILAILLIVSTGGAFAFEIIDDGEVTNQYTPLYIGTSRITASLSMTAHGTANCYSSVVLYSGYDANLTMYLQRKTSYGSWITVTSWSGSGSGASGVTLSKTYNNLITGTTYRVYAVAYVYQNGNYIERVSVSSQELTY